MKKRLILLMLSLSLVGGSLTGCSSEEPMVGKSSSGGKYDHKYLTMEDCDGDIVLHKGTITKGSRETNNCFDFICSEPFMSNKEYTAHDNKPNYSFYDEICEDCFY